MSDSDLPFARDALLAHYEQVHNNRRDYVERMWGTVHYFTTLFTSLITLSVGGALLLLQREVPLADYSSDAARIPLAVLSLMAGIMAVVGLANLRRECENEHVQMGLILIAEHALGLHMEVPEPRRFFKQEALLHPNILFLPRQSLPGADPRQVAAPTLDEFVSRMMAKKRSFLRFFTRVFTGFVVLSLVVTVLIIWMPSGS